MNGAYFTVGPWRRIEPDDPWPDRRQRVYVHHPALGDRPIICPYNWRNAQLQAERLDQLWREDFRPRRLRATDWYVRRRLTEELQRAGCHSHVIDHEAAFRRGDEFIVTTHTYVPDDKFRDALVEAVARVNRGHAPYRIAIEWGDHYNIYFPESGTGFAIGRPRYFRERSDWRYHQAAHPPSGPDDVCLDPGPLHVDFDAPRGWL